MEGSCKLNKGGTTRKRRAKSVSALFYRLVLWPGEVRQRSRW